MTATRMDARQIALRAAQAMLDSAANDTLDIVLPKVNNLIAKNTEDRNLMLASGGLITFTGTAVQFTESLKLHINSSSVQTGPIIIDLGSTTRTVSADGKMIYAILNRSAATATITEDATNLSAVVSGSNSEVFVIAKRVDATDGTQRLYFANGFALNAGQTLRLGAGGTGGGGLGDDLSALTFKASFTDNFDDIPSAAVSAVDITSGKTDSTLYSAVNALYTLNYDAAKTVTGTGTSMALSATITQFTPKAGDILVVGTEARRIATWTSFSSFTIESAYTANPSTSACCITQAVYTKDLNNTALDGLAVSNTFSTNISEILVTYDDTTTSGDKIPDNGTAPVVAYTASSDGSSYSQVQTRTTSWSTSTTSLVLPTSSTSLYLRLFANKTSGAGTVNVLGYKVFFHKDTSILPAGNILNQAYCFTNSVGTPINCSNPTVVGGKTRITLTFSYPVAVNSGTANGAVKVLVNGQKIPRFVDSTLTPDASYTESSANTIDLDSDYSSLNMSVEIIRDVGVIDASTTNSASISNFSSHQFTNRLINSNFAIWQRGSTATIAANTPAYLADQWYAHPGTTGTLTYSRVAGVQPGSVYGASLVVLTTGATSPACELVQPIENMNTIDLLSQYISSSVYVKAAGLVTQVGISLVYGTSEAKFAAATSNLIGTETLLTVSTSGFVQGKVLAAYVGSLPTTAGIVGIRIRPTAVSSGSIYAVGNGFVVEKAVVNVGTVDMPWARAGRNHMEEIAMCQRYYEKSYDIDTALGTSTAVGAYGGRIIIATNTDLWTVLFKITKRADVVGVIYSQTGAINTYRNTSTSTDAAASAGNGSMTGMIANLTTGAFSNGFSFHWTADASI